MNIETPAILANNYRFIDFLGEGANGKTWLARTILGEHRVAVKSLKLSQIENLKSLDLFHREAEVLESISVHGVPKFYEAIMDSDGSGECYLIQQYIDAPSIQSYLDAKRIFSEKTALQLMRKVANILKQLEMDYQPPIIHRDIKPSNILCTIPDDSDDPFLELDPWLIDFGAVANPQKRQQGSTVAGTIGYMAPEQIVGDNSVQADYYALGATILHMITGVPPYQIPNELFVLKFKPVLEEKAPATSPYLIELLDILLQKDPAQRPHNITELIQYIDNVIAHRSPKASQIQNISHQSRLEIFIDKFKQLFTKAQWKETEGYITCIKSYVSIASPVLQYTYSIDGDYFTNLFLIPDNKSLQSYLKSLKCPIKCTVKYNPENRGYSTILIDKLYDQSINYTDLADLTIPDFSNSKTSDFIKPIPKAPDLFLKTPKILKQNQYLCLTSDSPFAMDILSWISIASFNNEEYRFVRKFRFDHKYDTSPADIEHLKVKFKQRKDHPIKGLPKFYDLITGSENSNHYYLVYEYISTPTIQDYLDNHIKFTESHVLLIMLKVATLLKRIQNTEEPIIIGDLSPHNIHIALEDIVSDNLEPNIWISGFYNDVINLIDHDILHLPIELISDKELIQSDFYALGTTALAILTESPISDIPMAGLELEFEETLERKRPDISPHMITLLKLLLAEEPTKRPPNASTLIQYIQNVLHGRPPKYQSQE